MKFIDPDGMKITDADEIIKKYKEHLVQTKKDLESLIDAGATGLDKLVDFQNKQLKKVKQLENSDQVYNVFYSEDGYDGGGTSYDEKTGNINLSFKKSSIDTKSPFAVVAHEIEHAVQYENEEISFLVDNSGYGTLYDIGDETASYNAQRPHEVGNSFFATPNQTYNSYPYRFSDADTRRFGESMTPPAYLNLPLESIDLKSDKGKNLRKQVVEAGKNGLPVKEVYKGWQKDYETGQKQSK